MSQENAPVWRRLIDGWTSIAARFGAVQTMVLLAVFYIVLLGPASAILSLARRDLLDKRTPSGGDTAWCEADTAGADLERVKQQS